MNKPITILGIESSCDETSASVCINGFECSNIIATQHIHELYGGVVPELASRAHQKNIIPVVDQALKEANCTLNDLDAIAFTRGPGLLGSLLVGTSFAKGLAIALQKPLIEVNHMQAHIIANFTMTLENKRAKPDFPFLCLTVSGGHTQIVKVDDFFRMEIVGQTLDDAAGEAFDKVAKLLGLGYPGGPLIDKLAKLGNANSYQFPKPKIEALNFSFSGLKTAIMNSYNKEMKNDVDFKNANLNNFIASVQHSIINILIDKLLKAAKKYNIKNIALAGGVSANSYLRDEVKKCAINENWEIFIPPLEYCTDNAAMIATYAHYKYLINEFADISIAPTARYSF